jgi:hypothetical protein
MQILTLEVTMKRQVSICIFLSILVIILSLLYIKVSNINRNNIESEEQEPHTQMTEEDSTDDTSITIGQDHIQYYFYAKNDEGRVSIYDVNSQTLYMETGIETSGLPKELQNKLETGIFFKDEIELFDFLENYSS